MSIELPTTLVEISGQCSESSMWHVCLSSNWLYTSISCAIYSSLIIIVMYISQNEITFTNLRSKISPYVKNWPDTGKMCFAEMQLSLWVMIDRLICFRVRSSELQYATFYRNLNLLSQFNQNEQHHFMHKLDLIFTFSYKLDFGRCWSWNWSW